jgi:hypothetical protein
MSEKLADDAVLVPVVPPGAVPGSPGPDRIIPTAPINAADAAAMRMPRRRHHGGGGSAFPGPSLWSAGHILLSVMA